MPRKAVKPASEERSATGKRARTRRLVLREARDCIAEKGIAGATAAEIARRCDLSWGVIQYHFGDRLGLFIALLEAGVESLLDSLVDLGSTHPAPEDRVGALIAGMWQLMRRPDYRVMVEIELQLSLEGSQRAQVRKYVRENQRKFAESWRKALPELPSESVDDAAGLATTALRGLALAYALEGARADADGKLELVRRSVLHILGLDDH